MDENLPGGLRTTFLLHMVIAVVLGLMLFLVPGRSLTLLGWISPTVRLPESDLTVPGTTLVDPILSRLLGAALLALAFSSFRGWRATRWDEVSLLVQMEVVFCILGIIAFLTRPILLNRGIPVVGWILTLILAAFAVAFGLTLRGVSKKPRG